jgi:hypothetical protein
MKRAILSLVLLLAACNEEVVYVDHYQDLCYTLVPTLCLRTGPDNATWDNKYSSIEGFTQTWGITSKVRVRVEQVQNPPADGSSRRVILVEELSREPVPAGTRFRLSGLNQETVTVDGTGNHELVNRVPFVCATPSLCADLDQRLPGSSPSSSFSAEFTHGNPMRLEQLF